MKVYLVLLLAAIALAVITSAANIRDVEDGQEDTQAVVEGQLGWIAETDNQLGEIRWVLNLMCNFQKKLYISSERGESEHFQQSQDHLTFYESSRADSSMESDRSCFPSNRKLTKRSPKNPIKKKKQKKKKKKKAKKPEILPIPPPFASPPLPPPPVSQQILGNF